MISCAIILFIFLWIYLIDLHEKLPRLIYNTVDSRLKVQTPKEENHFDSVRFDNVF